MASGKRDSTDREHADELLPIDDDKIISMSVKELNGLLKSMKPNEAASIKRRRRILKNKGYAASSRHRQTSLVDSLSVERNQLIKQINQLTRDNDHLLQELRGWKQRYTDLQLLTSPPSTTSLANDTISQTMMENRSAK